MGSVAPSAPRSLRTLIPAVAVALGVVAWAAVAPFAEETYLAVAAVAAVAGLVYLAWHADPAVSFTVGLCLYVFAGRWDRLGLPTILAPDRILLATAIAAVLFNPTFRRRPLPRHPDPAVAFMAAAFAFALVSAAASGTLFDRDSAFALVERFGAIPFLLYVAARTAIRTQRQREVVLAGFVVLGGYLGLTALFETLKISPLIIPAYIDDPTIGILPDRARGPFLEPATNGLALFACAGASLIAARTWRSGWARSAAVLVAGLCFAGLLFTLTRQVWVAAIVSSLVVALCMPRLRPWLVPGALTAAAAVAVLVLTIPGLSETVAERRAQQSTIYDRVNLNNAAINAIEAHPLTGVGWQAFRPVTAEYAELHPNIPLTAMGGTVVHNLFLAYGADLGLVGLTLWLVALVLAVGGTLVRRGPPESRPWWALLLGVSLFFGVIAMFEYPQTFSIVLVFLLAGIVRGAQEAAR
jgi:O-antigen ligase